MHYAVPPVGNDWFEIPEEALDAALATLDYTIHARSNCDFYQERWNEETFAVRWENKLFGNPEYFKPAAQA